MSASALSALQRCCCDWPSFCQHLADRCHSAQLLLGSGVTLSADDVHELRLTCKHLRAAWQLLRPWQQPELCRLRNRAIADLAASLAGRRDQDVLMETLRRLARQATEIQQQALQQAGAFLQPASQPAAASEQPHGNPHHSAQCATLHGEQQLWLAMAALRPPRRWWQKGHARLHKRRLQLAALAADQQHDEDFHSWRKWVKYELYACQLAGLGQALAGSKPKTGRQRRAAAIHQHLQNLDRLGSLLGKLHDLTDLRERLQAMSESTEGEPLAWLPVVCALLDERIAERKQAALQSD